MMNMKELGILDILEDNLVRLMGPGANRVHERDAGEAIKLLISPFARGDGQLSFELAAAGKTFPIKEDLKQEGFRWTGASPWGWVYTPPRELTGEDAFLACVEKALAVRMLQSVQHG